MLESDCVASGRVLMRYFASWEFVYVRLDSWECLRSKSGFKSSEMTRERQGGCCTMILLRTPTCPPPFTLLAGCCHTRRSLLLTTQQAPELSVAKHLPP